MTRATLDAGGAISHHHGIGLNRARFLADGLGPAFDVLASVKAALDPHGILNPGKLGLASPVRAGALAMSILVIDVGTSGVRGAVVRPDASVEHIHHVPVLPDTPFPGLVEFDGRAIADAVVEVATRQPGRGRARRRRGHRQPTGLDPGVGPGDRRAGRSRARVAGPADGRHLPGAAGPGHPRRPQRLGDQAGRHPRRRPTPTAPVSERGELAFGTIDTWVAWILSEGELHVTDASNAGVTGLHPRRRVRVEPDLLAALAIPEAVLPEIVDSSGALGHRRRPRPVRHPSPAWPATSRPR